MTNLVAITRAVGRSIVECELTFLARQPIDVARAAQQHGTYCDVLRAAGVWLLELPAEESLPDAVFVEDGAVVLDEVAVITRPGIEARRRETPAIAEALRTYRPIASVDSPATLEGGDVLRVGRRIFIGKSTRTNDEGYAQFSSIAQRYGYQPTQVEVHGCLHLKTAVSALDEDTLLVNRSWIDADRLSGFRLLDVSIDEPFAANTLNLHGVIHRSSSWTRTRDILEREGFATRSLGITEFEKAEAGLTCLSLIFKTGQ